MRARIKRGAFAGSVAMGLLVSAAGLEWTPRDAMAGTFEPRSLAPDAGIDVLHRGLAREHLDRDLFANPYASVLFGSVDVYDVFPYVESRYFLAVSDPEWNRIVFSDTKHRRLTSFDGVNSELGTLRSPRGMAVDERNNIYVCDTDNDRIVILAVSTEFDDVSVTAIGTIEGFSRPYDVAHSDAGTAFDPSDDRLYVADTGKNAIARLERSGDSFVETARLGALGSGVGRFAGPMAITVGRDESGNNGQVFVADVHNRRIVELEDSAHGLTWHREALHDPSLVTSLDTDQWGQVYASSPSGSQVLKFTAALEPVAVLQEGVEKPRSFHVPFVNVTDHRSGEKKRVGQPNGLVVEDWNTNSGVGLWALGVEARDFEAETGTSVAAQFHLTDPADVTVRWIDEGTGELVAERDFGLCQSGSQSLAFEASDLLRPVAAGMQRLELVVRSGYEDGPLTTARTTFDLSGAPESLHLARPFFAGSFPNPFRPQTEVRFYLPEESVEPALLSVFDLSGRLVHRKSVEAGESGWHTIPWNGRTNGGGEVHAGVYYYRVEVAGQSWNGKMVRLQ